VGDHVGIPAAVCFAIFFLTEPRDILLLYDILERRAMLLRSCCSSKDFTKTLVIRRQRDMHHPITMLSCYLPPSSTTTTTWDSFMRMSKRESWVPRRQMSTSKVPIVCGYQTCPTMISSNVVIRIVDRRCNCRHQSSQASSSHWTCFWCARRAG
jgi:hypothetical protein